MTRTQDMKKKQKNLRALAVVLTMSLLIAEIIPSTIFSYAQNMNESESGAYVADYPEQTESLEDEIVTNDENAEENSGDENVDAEEEETEKAAEKPLLKAPGATRKVSTVWFDGTLGLGTTNSLVQGATNVSASTDSYGYVTLPTSAGNNTKYSLNGWYDIKAKTWHKPGERVQVSDNTVFYADWVKSSYNLQQNGTLASGQANTSNFVTTEVFDYNELINTYHGATLSSNTIYSNSHSETWKDNGGTSFLFMNWYNENLHGYGSLGAANNLTTGRNAYKEGLGVTKNIVTSESSQLIDDFFSSEDALGKKYLGNGNNLFLYDSSGTTESRGFGEGYYYYDSDYNGADYNQSQQRFYVYNTQQYIQGQKRQYNRWDNDQRRPGFMPFEQGTVYEKSGQTDYWFGMKTTVDFFLPDNVGSNGGNCNKSHAGKDMRFYFSGDDDVWVFVDDKLVLDLGGIHERCAGDINFSTGEIRYYTVDDNGNETLLSVDRNTLKSISAGNHKLKIYYLERGSSWSNCSIYFNLVPRYDIKIVKTDADEQTALLPGAEFTVYLDEACTVPAMLYDNKNCTGTAKSVFTTNEQGIIECYGMLANRTYYLKETCSPATYPSVSDKVIALKLDANGNASLVNTDESFAVVPQNGSTTVNMNIKNKKPEETSVGVVKKWYNEDGTPLTENIPDSVQVQLYRSETATPQHGGGSSGASIPVSITTQYFGRANGSNRDNTYLTAGDLSKNLIVVSGGSLHLNLDVLKMTGQNRYQAGIYSVTVNGSRIEPSSVSGRTNQECYIGGRWGQFPPIHAEYDISNITRETDIKITLIGYLNYQSSTPLVSKTLSIDTTVIAPPDPDPGEELVIPTVKPEDAVPFGDPITLDDSNQWKHVWEGLPVTNEDGTVTYYYYVEEQPVPGYSISYSGNGTVGGNVTVSNVRLREIVVKKVWKNAAGDVMQNGMPDSINCVLTQTNKTTGATREIDFTLNNGNGWKKQWRSDDAELAENKDHEYEYTVKEISAVDGFEAPVYENNEGIQEGNITITNQKTLYKLPNTGGMGTYIFCFVGGFLITLALLLINKDGRGRSGRRRRRGRHAAASLLLTMIMVSMSFGAHSMNAYASTHNTNIPEIEQAAPLTLTVNCVFGGESNISGVEIEICKIADLVVEDSVAQYSFTEEFASFGEFPQELSASESSNMAKNLYRAVKDRNISTIRGYSDANGQIAYTDLTPGLYLIAQVTDYKIEDRIYQSDPFLASIPQPDIADESGSIEWQYNVVALPKAVNSKEIVPPEKEKPPENEKTGKVKTGDTNDLAAAGLLLIISSAALMLTINLQQRRRNRYRDK